MTSGSHKASEALGLWEPKRTLTLEAARRHSQRIRFLRQLLLMLATLLILTLVWQFASRQSTFIQEDNPEETVKMINPRYSGRTKDGLPYRLTAAFATREVQNDALVQLTNPVLHFLRDKGAEESIVIAESGTYDDVNKVLNLRTAVDLETDDGYHCVTTHARVFAKEKRIEGDEPIACTGNFGEANGNSYEILDDYKVFIFKDGMDAVIERSADAGGAVDIETEREE